GVVVTTIRARPIRTAGLALAYQNSGYLLDPASSYQRPLRLAPRIRSGESALYPWISEPLKSLRRSLFCTNDSISPGSSWFRMPLSPPKHTESSSLNVLDATPHFVPGYLSACSIIQFAPVLKSEFCQILCRQGLAKLCNCHHLPHTRT